MTLELFSQLKCKTVVNHPKCRSFLFTFYQGVAVFGSDIMKPSTLHLLKPQNISPSREPLFSARLFSWAPVCLNKVQETNKQTWIQKLKYISTFLKSSLAPNNSRCTPFDNICTKAQTKNSSLQKNLCNLSKVSSSQGPLLRYKVAYLEDPWNALWAQYIDTLNRYIVLSRTTEPIKSSTRRELQNQPKFDEPFTVTF